MHKRPFPYQYIAIEGNIGAGKTTLSERLAHDFGCRLVLEEFSDNPFLPYFYENPERYGFPVELFFMTERHKQLQEEMGQIDLFANTCIVADYFFHKTLLFARNTLKADEFRLFQRLFDILKSNFRRPDVLVYLYRPVPDLLANIQKRGRSYEQNMDPDYLENIQATYLEYFRSISDRPVLVLEMGDIDFINQEQHYRQIVAVLQQEYPNGLHRLDLRGGS